MELARRTGYSQSTISRMERGELAVSMLAAARWAWHLRVPRAHLRRLVALAREAAGERAALEPIRVILQQGIQSVQRKIRLRERNAQHQVVYHPSILPGLLQTAAYVEMVMQDGTDDDVSADIAEREQRKREAATRSITFVIPEGCLYQGVPDPQLMANQCDHLADLATNHRYWRVGVIPRITAVGRRPNITQNGFDVYDDVEVFIGTTAGNAHPKDRFTITQHLERFDLLTALAVFGEEARDVFSRVADEYRSHPAAPTPPRSTS